ncbi:MAG: hypothetical protein ACRDI2_26970 [Chloroflexota bacterium]
MLFFRKTRRRWALGRAAFQAVQDVGPSVKQGIEETRAEALDLRRQISELPGASPLCPRCNGRLVMKRSKEPTGWFKLWICHGCGYKDTLTDLPRRSLDNDR